MVDESCKEVRSISHQMMPNALLRSGLASALKTFIEKIDAERLKVNLEADGLSEVLNHNIEIVLYRVIQEAVNCTSPLKDWTKFRKQFRTIKLGNHEKREKNFHA